MRIDNGSGKGLIEAVRAAEALNGCIIPLMTKTASLSAIQSAITDEIFYALGLGRRGVLRRGLGWVFALPTRRFARHMAAVDGAVGEGGPAAGCQVMLDRLGVRVGARGADRIPASGPAVILANHPGAYDSMAIGSLIPRRDLKVLVGKTRFYEALPNIHPHLIGTSPARGDSMLALRAAADHLSEGGVLLQFGSGLIEPDPATDPVGDEVFDRWPPSMEILLRKVPETRVVPAIASGVLLPRFRDHPLVRLRRDAMDKRRLAEFMQVIWQLLFPKSIDARPRISFGQPFRVEDAGGDTRRVMPLVIAKMKAQLEDHLRWSH